MFYARPDVGGHKTEPFDTLADVEDEYTVCSSTAMAKRFEDKYKFSQSMLPQFS